MRGTQDATDDPEKTPTDNPGQEAAKDLNDLGTPNDPLDPLDPNANITSAKNEIRAKLRAGGAITAITGIVCLVKAVADTAGETEYQEIVTESIRHAGYMVSFGGQVMSGQDMNMVQAAFESEAFQDKSDDDNEGTRPNSFFDAGSWQAESGNPGKGVEYADSTKLGGASNILTQFVDSLPGFADSAITTGCKFAGSIIGQVISFAVDFALGPVSAAAGFATGILAAPYFDDLARMVAKDFIPADPTGAVLGHVVNQGGFFLANQQFITMGATALSDDERAELKVAQIDRVIAANQEKSWTERYLSPTNANSLVAKTIDEAPTASSALNNIATLPTSLFKNLGKMFTKKVSAASHYDYGVPKYAFRPSELSKTNNDETYINPYENANKIANIPAMHTAYSEKCFGVKFTLNSETGEETSFQMTTPVDMRMRKDKYPEDCKRADEEFTRYRLYVADLMTFETNNCYEGDEQSCALLGYGTAGT